MLFSKLAFDMVKTLRVHEITRRRLANHAFEGGGRCRFHWSSDQEVKDVGRIRLEAIRKSGGFISALDGKYRNEIIS